MLSDIFSEKTFSKKLVSLADTVTFYRPRPLRDFDQIYMMSGDMLAQAELMKSYIETKRIVFLGDGDGMSMLFGLLAVHEYFEPPKRMLVLDFDERILRNIDRFAQDNRFSSIGIAVETLLYNVIDILPDKMNGIYDFFYINPPYGSKNAGKSTLIWLDRCLELCTMNCSGCIVIPYDDRQPWSQDAMLNIQQYLVEHGFVVRDMVSQMHYYHLKDNPGLQSATIIVDRVARRDPDYSQQGIPIDSLKHLYGAPRPLPHYIRIDESDPMKGKADYDWLYGKEKFWERPNI